MKVYFIFILFYISSEILFEPIRLAFKRLKTVRIQLKYNVVPFSSVRFGFRGNRPEFISQINSVNATILDTKVNCHCVRAKSSAGKGYLQSFSGLWPTK